MYGHYCLAGAVCELFGATYDISPFLTLRITIAK